MSDRRLFEIDADDAGLRLDRYLQQRLGFARSLVLKALRKGWVRVDGKRAKSGLRLEAGAKVKITNYALPLPEQEPVPVSVGVPEAEVAAARESLIHQDPDFLVSSKPAGAVVHRGSGHPHGWIDAVSAALNEPPPTPIGRLDRDTSGLLLLSRTPYAARTLFEGLRSGAVRRSYLALVEGELRDERGEFNEPLKKSKQGGQEQMRVDPKGKPASTRFLVQRRRVGATLVRVELDTGRTHQIRAHFASAGHPLLGDPRYGSPASRALSERLGVGRLFLHAASLALPHPRDESPLSFDDPLPPELAGPVGD